MTDSLLRASHYGARENQAVYSVLIELSQILGSQSGKFVLVGGSVPALLFGNAVPEHIGTLDIDLLDAYDIWFCIRNFEGGSGALAESCKPLMREQEAKDAYENIADKFRSLDDFGPDTVRRFLEDSPEKCGEMTPEQIQNDAYFRVNEWLVKLGIVEAED